MRFSALPRLEMGQNVGTDRGSAVELLEATQTGHNRPFSGRKSQKTNNLHSECPKGLNPRSCEPKQTLAGEDVPLVVQALLTRTPPTADRRTQSFIC